MPRMTTESTLQDLRERLEAGYPLLFLRTWEERRWERLLADLALEMERGLVTWTQTAGWQPPVTELDQLPSILAACEQYPPEHLFLLKDFHPQLADPNVVRQLRDLAAVLPERKQAILLMDPVAALPAELEKDAIVIPLPLPGYSDFREGLDELLSELRTDGFATELSPEDEDHLIQAVLGLTFAEAHKAWVRALQSRTKLDDAALTVLVSEKRTLASASDLLEFHDLEAGVDDVGGLDELKRWLQQRALAYTPKAREQGIPLPKGALLLGVQGCGKSLTARASARMLSFPLVRLDMSRLLESGRGESERNLREVLHLVESISPVVFWLDELEKGFAGMGGDEFTDATMARIVGTFLMWMQEQQRAVFVIATANSVHNLPPEMLRRGRFDELFFIDLPNFHERHHILQIHLSKRNWKPERFQLDELAQRTEGYSGAELEQIVSSAIIDAFGRGQVITDLDLDRARRQLVPLSKTMEDKIFALRQWAQDRCRRATSDNRAAQMLDEEQRMGDFEEEDDQSSVLPSWAVLAQAGQLKAAIVEYVRREGGDILFPELCAALQNHVDMSGEQGLAVRSNPNTVLWLGMSKDLCEAIIELSLARRLYVHPTDPERYRRANLALKLPVLLEPTDEKLPRPKWLPASLRTASPCSPLMST
ncbi:MAG: AAA family ATPase [Planctomycetaceae bacterium]|nr:AAA family ATPase [Planctomycetaceae bacterium]